MKIAAFLHSLGSGGKIQTGRGERVVCYLAPTGNETTPWCVTLTACKFPVFPNHLLLLNNKRVPFLLPLPLGGKLVEWNFVSNWLFMVVLGYWCPSPHCIHRGKESTWLNV